MKKIFFVTAVPLFSLIASAVDIFMAGDSTMSNYHEMYKPLMGWGEKLKSFTVKGVNIRNHAVGGRSSKNFRSLGNWKRIMERMKKGDFVILQFGHNDSFNNTKAYVEPKKEFPENMRRYIREVRAKGGIPVVISMTAACRFDKNGKAVNTQKYQAYVDAAKNVAASEKAAFIDVNAWMLEELTRIGKAEAEKQFFMYLPPGKYPAYPKGKKDYIHLKDSGALRIARAVVQMAKKANLPIAKYFTVD